MNSKPKQISSTRSLPQLKKGPSKNPYKKAVSDAKLAYADKEKGSDQSKTGKKKSLQSKGSKKTGEKGYDKNKARKRYEHTKALRVSDSKKGLRAFLALTPQEKKRRASVSRKVRHLLKARHVVVDGDDDGGEEPRTKKRRSPIRYKLPIEKLAKKIKRLRRDEIPSDIDIHRRRLHRASFTENRAVRHEVDRIRKILTDTRRTVQPNVGWDYDKKQRRLLLGFRHRPLDNKWYYFHALRDAFPRGLKPNDHFPDAIFFVVNLYFVMMTGYIMGFSYASDGFIRILEDTYDFEAFRNNKSIIDNAGHRYWVEKAPFDYYSTLSLFFNSLMYLIILLGFVGIYRMDQKIHLAYVILMIICLLGEAIVAANMASQDYCTGVVEDLERLLTLLVDNYYEKVVARDLDGHVLTMPGTSSPVEIRTYKAANVIDRIQRDLHCCGVNGLDDYVSQNMDVPSSCCTPLWNLNPHCADVIPTDKVEYRAKFQIKEGKDLGCMEVLQTVCKNLHRMMGTSSRILNGIQWVLFIVSLTALIMQSRQIRQLRRWPHLRISAGSISQSLQASAGTEGVKTGGGGVRAVAEASKFTEKQQERLQQTRRENLFQHEEVDEESSESSEESSDELPVHTVNFGELKTLQKFVDTEDKTQLEMPDLDKTVEGFAGRFNILANPSLKGYVSGIFSTTYQNETNAGLEAIAQTLESQFAQHTTDYDWRKLLTKPKQKVKVTQVKSKKSVLPVITRVQKKVKPRSRPPTQQRRSSDHKGQAEVSETGGDTSSYSGSE